MNRLDISRRTQVVKCLVEGMSVRATVRVTGVAKNTVAKLLVDLGCACAAYHHRNVRGLKVKRLQADEIWSFVGAKKKNVTLEQKVQGWGDVWTWVGIDADTKLVVSYLLGDRGKDSAFAFILDCAERIVGRPQLTTDALSVYPDAVEEVFGSSVDYAQLHKIYSAPTQDDFRRYSPARCIGCDMKTIQGDPDPKHVSTSYVERSNLTMRMSMRRFTRLTNAFSKKLDNHGHAVALHFIHYNFCRVHQTLRVTPAMEAGLTDHIWEIDELVSLLGA
ncbi:MAG TPA: IS1 family transposase [Acidobacteriaceae bacterium]|nr:IS1 family transposase [Acidobacteriaceae bacterium]